MLQLIGLVVWIYLFIFALEWTVSPGAPIMYPTMIFVGLGVWLGYLIGQHKS